MTTVYEMLPGEFWWGGSADDGAQMPFSAETVGYARDFRVSAPNQTMPLYVSSRGRYIWSERPFAVRIDGGKLFFEGDGVTLTQAGETLRDAYLAAQRAHFPFGGKVPPEAFFRTAQYNSWMEFTYTPRRRAFWNMRTPFWITDFFPVSSSLTRAGICPTGTGALTP